MSLPTIAGVVRAAVQGLVPSQQKWVNVHHFQYAGGASAPGLAEVTILDPLLTRLYTGAAFATGASWFSFCPSAVTITGIDYVLLDGSSIGWSFAKAAAGQGTGSMPSECSPVLTLLTNKRGRRYRGRVYMPVPTTAQGNTDGTLQTSTRNSIVNQYAGMLLAMAAAQWAPVVASYGKGSHLGAPTTWTPFATPIVGTRMDQFIDVQRARKN